MLSILLPDTLWHDLRYAVRVLVQNRGFSSVAILTLALGIGVNVAMFSVLEGVVLAPLPYPNPGQLVVLALYNRSLKSATYLSYPDFLDWQRNSRSFDKIAAFSIQGFNITGPGQAQHVDGKQVSSTFFGTLGVKPALGRDFAPEDDRYGAAPAVVITHRLWQQRFGGHPAALGSAVDLFGASFTIVGILPPDFRFGNQEADVYTALGRRIPMFNEDRTVHDVLCIARLRPGMTAAQAKAEMNAVQERIDALNPRTERGLGVDVTSLKQMLVGDVSATLLLLLGAVGLVLLIASVNVANLFLARSLAREREFFIRAALGAGPMRLARQVLLESVVLSLSGAAVGVASAAWGVKAIVSVVPGKLPRADNIGLDGMVLLFAVAIAIGVGILFGLLPALRTSRAGIATALNTGARSSAGMLRQDLLAIGELALAVVLLMGASLLFRTIHNLLQVNPGFDQHHIVTFQVGLAPSVNTASKIRSAYRELIQRIREIPGVETADLTALVPMGEGSNEGPFWIGPHQPASMAEIPRAIYYPTGPDYIHAMKIPLLRGRALNSTDTVGSEPVVLIDTFMVQTYFPGRDPVGQTLTIPHWGAGPAGARIVGVVGHVHQYGVDGSVGEKPQIYYSLYQLPDAVLPVFQSEVTLAVRTRNEAAVSLLTIRKAVDKTSSGQPVYNIRTMQEIVSSSLARQRFPMVLLVAFAALALLLACIGVYGVISYVVTQRVKEIGIRIAVGADRSDVLRMITGRGIKLALAGIAVGAALTFLLATQLRGFSHLLYGLRSNDPATFVFVAFLLITATLLACYLPARRASRVDPIVALRHE